MNLSPFGHDPSTIANRVRAIFGQFVACVVCRLLRVFVVAVERVWEAREGAENCPLFSVRIELDARRFDLLQGPTKGRNFGAVETKIWALRGALFQTLDSSADRDDPIAFFSCVRHGRSPTIQGTGHPAKRCPETGFMRPCERFVRPSHLALRSRRDRYKPFHRQETLPIRAFPATVRSRSSTLRCVGRQMLHAGNEAVRL